MNLDELIDLLSDIRDDVGGNTEVRLAFQPNWPLAYHISNVTVASSDEDDDFEEDSDSADQKPIVWIAEGSHPSDSPYAPRSAWDR